MAFTTRAARPANTCLLRLLGMGACVLLASSLFTATAASADTAVSPRSGYFAISGAGWGHGWGMSQYGAYGAATKGLTWQRILAFYYPGTKLIQQPSGYLIRVWISADTDGDLRVKPSAGLTVRDASGHSYLLPTGSKYRVWRVKRSGTGYSLSYLNADGTWITQPTSLSATTWRFSDTAKIVKVVMPTGSVREYRGSVALVKWGTTGRTVNRVRMETYLKAVVPLEMPTSWLANAVRSQAVAARSYATKLKEWARYSSYDICDTTACQSYRGYAVTYRGVRTVNETANGNAAIAATARMILTYNGTTALTQYATSNGGHSARGDYPYLTAQPDPYDGIVISQAWSRSISSASISQAWPWVGTVKQLQITARDGAGQWGGRVQFLKIIGSAATITISGNTFQRTFGLKSTLFTIRPTSTTTSAALTATTDPSVAASPAVAPTVGGQSVKATAYGAVCDGRHDDRSAIVKALAHLGANGGGVLDIPGGNCRILQTSKSRLTGIPANVTIRGTGATSRLLLACDAPNSYREMFRINGDNVRIENLTLMRSTPCSGVMIALRPHRNFTLSSVTMDGQYQLGGGTMHALLMPNLSGGTYRGISMVSSTIKNFPGYGVLQPNEAVTTTDGILVDGCIFSGNRSDDLEFNAPKATMKNVTVQNSTFTNNRSTSVHSGFGIGLANVQNVLIANNSFSHYRREPIHIEDHSRYISISNNTFRNSYLLSTSWASHVTILSGSRNITVARNTFDASANVNPIKAVFIGTGGTGYPVPSDIEIKDNTFLLRANSTMVYWSGVPNVTISGNTVQRVA